MSFFSMSDVESSSTDEDAAPFEITPRQVWGAMESAFVRNVVPPLDTVILSFVRKDYFRERSKPSPGPRPDWKQCHEELRYVQRGDMRNGSYDIRFNFIVCNDSVYEGRGWTKVPSLPKKYRQLTRRTFFIGLLGDFRLEPPDASMFNVADEIIREGVTKRVISPKFLQIEMADPFLQDKKPKIGTNYISGVYM